MFMALKSTVRNILGLGLIVAATVSCGNRPSIVKDVGVTPYIADQDVYASVDALFELNNMSLPALSVPIRHPKGQQVIGHLTSMANANIISIEVNLSAVARLEAGMGRLPNGSPLPVFGFGSDLIELEIPTGQGNVPSQLYISWSPGSTILGFAIPIKQLDRVGERVGQQVLMPSFRIKSVPGAAGVYTSFNAEENGLAAFFDLTSVFTLPEIQPYAHDEDLLGFEEIQTQFVGQAVPDSERAEKAINYEIYRLDRKRTKFDVAK